MQPHAFYINANIRNNENTYQTASYMETRTRPILAEDVSSYQVAVERFSISTNTIPLWIPHIEYDVTRNATQDVNQTIYVVSVLDSTSDSKLFSAPLMWTPQITDEPVPSFSQSRTPSRYYYMYTVHHFVEMFNKALEGADLSSVPKLTFEDGKFSLFANSDYDAGNPDQKYRLVFNESLSILLQSFAVEKIQSRNVDHFHSVVFKNMGTNVLTSPNSDEFYAHENYTLGQPTGDYQLMMTQERGSLVDFQVFRGILFTTGSLPVRSEGVCSPTEFGKSTQSTADSSDATQNVLCDMDAVLGDDSMTNQGVLQYQPRFLHKIDLRPASKIETLQFNVYWKDPYGNSHPLYLRHGSVNVKFAFFRR